MLASLRLKAVFVAVTCATLASAGDVRARPEFEFDPPVPNVAYTLAANGMQRPCITCHNNPDGGLTCGGAAPCLNPFGTSIRPAVMSGGALTVWTPSVAAADADGDGYTNGQELQDPLGQWVINTARPGNASYVTRPGFADDSPGLYDADGDRYCWFGRDLDMNGTCTGVGESGSGFDCNDALAAANSGAVEICSDTIDNDCNGQPTLTDMACVNVVDRDGDGYCKMGRDLNADRNCLGQSEMTSDVDCLDTSNTVFPGAPENCTDGADNDCDNLTDMLDPNCTGESDVDGDHYCPIGQDFMPYDGDCLDPGENTAVSDCNDQLASVNPGIAEICGDAQDNDCDGAADFLDAECASVTDADGDGACPNGRDLDHDGSCIDANEAGAAMDCDDHDPLRSSLATEICTDALDQDCDDLTGIDDPDCVRYLDTDGDGYCPVGIDLAPQNGNCADMNEVGQPDTGVDCDDAKPAVNPAVTEENTLCYNGDDDNCNGQADGTDPNCSDYADPDFDGFCVIGRDTTGDHACDDPGEQTSDEDEAPDDSTVFPGAPENCFDHKDNDQDGFADFLGEGTLPMDPKCRKDIDADGDGACPVGRDLNGDGDCLDTGENYRESDCNDADPLISPRAIEDYIEGLPTAMQPCFDHRDNDCDSDVDYLHDVGCFYVFDLDEDGYCRHGIDDTGDGDCLDASEDRGGVDCNDDDPAIRPGAAEICTDGVDNDCDTFPDGEDASCDCGVASDCEAMTCQTATCNAGECEYAPVEGCDAGGGKCEATTAAPGAGWPALLSCALAALAVGARRRRVRRGSFGSNR